MSKTIVVAGHGSGISNAVAEKFGAQGFSVAIIARSTDKLAFGVRALEAKGVKAVAVPADLSSLEAVRDAMKKARAALGPITVLHWNAATSLAGDLLTAKPEELVTALNVTTSGLVAAVQEVLPDLRAQRETSAVLVTNGGLGAFHEHIDEMAVNGKFMGLAVANSAKHKVARLLGMQLAREHIYMGEVMVLGVVKGTSWDRGFATLEASTIAERFYGMYTARRERLAQVGG